MRGSQSEPRDARHLPFPPEEHRPGGDWETHSRTRWNWGEGSRDQAPHGDLRHRCGLSGRRYSCQPQLPTQQPSECSHRSALPCVSTNSQACWRDVLRLACDPKALSSAFLWVHELPQALKARSRTKSARHPLWCRLSPRPTKHSSLWRKHYVTGFDPNYR